MQATEKSWRTKDRTEWGMGPWIDEPDKIQWVDEATDFDCLAVRNTFGAWCGYVGVPDTHPFHGVGYSACPDGACENSWECGHSPESRLSVHGGITFADACHEPTEEQWRKQIAEAANPKLIAEAERYPTGDAARCLKSYREAATMTFAEWVEREIGQRICHVPLDGRPGNVWWFGFDCAHAGDYAPGLPSTFSLQQYEEYRTLDYVRGECRSLAEQLSDVG